MKQHRRPLHRLISDGLFDRKSERWSTPASASSRPLSGTFKTKGCRVKQVRRRGTARLSSAPSPRRVAHLMAASRRHRPRAGRPHTCPPARRCRFTSSLARGRTAGHGLQMRRHLALSANRFGRADGVSMGSPPATHSRRGKCRGGIWTRGGAGFTTGMSGAHGHGTRH